MPRHEASWRWRDRPRPQAAGLILFDPLQLPAQGVAEHLLHLLAAHAAKLTIGHAQTLDCDAQPVGYKAGAVKIPGA